MSDLISRSELYDQLANKLTWLMGYGDDLYLAVGSDIKDVIDNMPIAYDVDKVVEELESFSKLAEDRWTNGTSKHAYQEHKCWVKSIEIVKHGGVSDDVCEWKLEDDNLMTGCGDYFNLYDNCTDKFKFCPTCGKKIKEVDQMDEDELRYCHHDDTDEYHDCLDYMECEECPYYYADLDQESD